MSRAERRALSVPSVLSWSGPDGAGRFVRGSVSNCPIVSALGATTLHPCSAGWTDAVMSAGRCFVRPSLATPPQVVRGGQNPVRVLTAVVPLPKNLGFKYDSGAFRPFFVFPLFAVFAAPVAAAARSSGSARGHPGSAAPATAAGGKRSVGAIIGTERHHRFVATCRSATLSFYVREVEHLQKTHAREQSLLSCRAAGRQAGLPTGGARALAWRLGVVITRSSGALSGKGWPIAF